MEKPKLQKTFYWSSEKVKKIIEYRINDIATENNWSTSYAIEQMLLNTLPQNKEARWYIENYLYSENGISNTIATIFSNSASRTIDNPKKHTNLKPLVEFMLDIVVDEIWSPQCDIFECWKTDLRLVIEKIDKYTKMCIEENDRELFERFSTEARMLQKFAEAETPHIRVKSHLMLANDCWDMLNGLSIFDEYICYLAQMGNFRDDAQLRNQLIDIVTTISNEW